jgi:hypothetical protein
MRHLSLIIMSVATLGGCASSYDTQQSTLAVNDRIDVLQASVSNPYPECDTEKEYRRVANLSVERAERVYLQEGALCQRSD